MEQETGPDLSVEIENARNELVLVVDKALYKVRKLELIEKLFPKEKHNKKGRKESEPNYENIANKFIRKDLRNNVTIEALQNALVPFLSDMMSSIENYLGKLYDIPDPTTRQQQMRWFLNLLSQNPPYSLYSYLRVAQGLTLDRDNARSLSAKLGDFLTIIHSFYYYLAEQGTPVKPAENNSVRVLRLLQELSNGVNIPTINELSLSIDDKTQGVGMLGYEAEHLTLADGTQAKVVAEPYRGLGILNNIHTLATHSATVGLGMEETFSFFYFGSGGEVVGRPLVQKAWPLVLRSVADGTSLRPTLFSIDNGVQPMLVIFDGPSNDDRAVSIREKDMKNVNLIRKKLGEALRLVDRQRFESDSVELSMIWEFMLNAREKNFTITDQDLDRAKAGLYFIEDQPEKVVFSGDGVENVFNKIGLKAIAFRQPKINNPDNLTKVECSFSGFSINFSLDNQMNLVGLEEYDQLIQQWLSKLAIIYLGEVRNPSILNETDEDSPKDDFNQRLVDGFPVTDGGSTRHNLGGKSYFRRLPLGQAPSHGGYWHRPEWPGNIFLKSRVEFSLPDLV